MLERSPARKTPAPPTPSACEPNPRETLSLDRWVPAVGALAAFTALLIIFLGRW